MTDLTTGASALVPKKAINRSITIILAIGLLSGLGVQAYEALDVSFTEIMPNLLSALGVVALLALLLERAVEVLLSIICGPEELRVKTQNRVRAQAQAETLAHEKAILEAMQSPEERLAFLSEGGGAARMASLNESDSEALEERTKAATDLRITKQYLSTLMLTVMGGALAACGVRILAQVFGADVVAGNGTLQMLDIVVTTLVLGGGAQGVHELISNLRRQ